MSKVKKVPVDVNKIREVLEKTNSAGKVFEQLLSDRLFAKEIQIRTGLPAELVSVCLAALEAVGAIRYESGYWSATGVGTTTYNKYFGEKK